MRHFLKAASFAVALATAGAHAADVPAYIGKRVTSPQDEQAIRKVIDDFQKALKTKDIKLLSSLMHSPHILFASPAAPAAIRRVRENIDVNFDGLPAGGYPQFAEFIKGEKAGTEEKFYNVRITQDGHVAFVMFDYEFLTDGKPENHGVEMWQMMKSADDKWKIASVFWTMNPVK